MAIQYRTHLLDPTFDRIDRTYCGMAGPVLIAPTTTDPAAATCKACLKLRHKLDQERPVFGAGQG